MFMLHQYTDNFQCQIIFFMKDPKFVGPKLQLVIAGKLYSYIMIDTVDSLLIIYEELTEFSKTADLRIVHLHKC